MARIVVECSNPNDLEAIVDAVELAAGKCPVTYFKQAKKLQEVGAVKSERAAARKIAEETGESPESVRQRIIDGKRSVVLKEPKESKPPETIQNPTPVIIEDRKPQGGGTREGAGRHRNDDRRVSQEFLEALNRLAMIIGLEKRDGWKRLSRKSALEMVGRLITQIGD